MGSKQPGTFTSKESLRVPLPHLMFTSLPAVVCRSPTLESALAGLRFNNGDYREHRRSGIVHVEVEVGGENMDS